MRRYPSSHQSHGSITLVKSDKILCIDSIILSLQRILRKYAHQMLSKVYLHTILFNLNSRSEHFVICNKVIRIITCTNSTKENRSYLLFYQINYEL